MSYRVEVAKTGRAGCQQAECKKQGLKIDQGSLRFGIWVEIENHGSWRWKHWGCITGKQLENVRTYLDPSQSGKYLWDKLDGYDDEDKGSLHDRPDLQEKVRRVITQGFIDPEDWKGDPEMNKLGMVGVFTSETKRNIRATDKARKAELEGLPPPSTDAETSKNKKPASKKRARAKEDSDDEEAFEKLKPAPKKRASKVKNEEPDADGERAEAKQKVRRGRKSAVKEEVTDEQDGIEATEAKPKVKRGAKKAIKEENIKEENGADDAPEVKPKAKRGAKKAVKEESVDEENIAADAPEVNPKAKRGAKKAVKEETNKGENSADDAPEVKPKARRGRKAAVKEEIIDEQNSVEAPEPKTAAKRGQKKAVKKEKPEPENIEDEYVKGEDFKGEPGEASSSLSYITPAAVEGKGVDGDPVAAAEPAETEDDQPKKKRGRGKSGPSDRPKRRRTASKN